MDPAFVGLLTAGIGFARNVISLFVSKTEGNQRTERQVTVVRERVLDKEALQRIIDSTNRHFAKMLETHTREIIKEVQRQRVQDSIHEVQARVSALKRLLSAQTIDPSITMHLVIQALNPLQVSLEVARFKLQDYGDRRAWQFCHIVGTSALISGYAFLGQDVSHMVAELEESMYESQKHILNEAAVKIIQAKGEIPWERVPQLLLPEGAEDLLTLYNSVMEEAETAEKLESIDVRRMNVDEIQSAVLEIDDAEFLMRMRREEMKYKNRVGAIQAITTRLDELSS